MSTNLVQIAGGREILGQNVNVYADLENPLFLARDVAEWIGHSNYRMMIDPVDDDEKGVRIAYTQGGPQECWFLTENGLYEVLFLSRKPVAKEFKKAVKSLLHDLRTGRKEIIEKPVSLVDQVILGLQAANQIIEEQKQQLAIAEQKIEANAPKVEFADDFLSSDRCYTIREFVKMIPPRLGKIKETEFRELLLAKEMLCKSRLPEARYEPTGKAKDKGWIVLVAGKPYMTAHGPIVPWTAKITPSGVKHFLQEYFKIPKSEAEKIVSDYAPDEISGYAVDFFANGLAPYLAN